MDLHPMSLLPFGLQRIRSAERLLFAMWNEAPDVIEHNQHEQHSDNR
jgi:hypothetical protein